MTCPSPAERSAGASSPYFAGFCIAVWTLGAAATPWVGIWPGVGGAALLLGTLALTTQQPVLVPLLRADRRALFQGLLGAVVLLGATYLLYAPAGRLPFDIPGQTEALYGRFRAAPALLTIVLLPLCVFSEEVIWRGIVQEAATARCGAAGGILLSAGSYAAAHAPVGSPLLLFIAVGCGVFWGWMRWRTGGLVAPLVCHLAWDVMVFSLLPLVR